MLKAKKFSLFIILALVIQVFGVVGMISASAENPAITIGTATTTAGSDVYLSIYINDAMTGIHNAHIVLNYNTFKLTLAGVQAKSIVPSGGSFTPLASYGQLILDYSDNSVDGNEITTTGEFARLKFLTQGYAFPEDISVSLATADSYFTLYNDATQTYENVTNLPHQDGYVTITPTPNAAVTVGSSSGTPGTTNVWVPVNIDNVYNGIHDFAIKIQYDTAKLTLTGLMDASIPRSNAGSFQSDTSTAGTIWFTHSGIDGQDIMQPGSLAILFFTIKSTATPGKTGISVISPLSYFNVFFPDLNRYQNITYIPCTSGYITIN